MSELSLADTVSIHKSPVSGYLYMVITFVMQNFMLVQRNYLYAGVIREKLAIIMMVSQKIKTDINSILDLIRYHVFS